MNMHVNATYHNPKCCLPPYSLNQSEDPSKTALLPLPQPQHIETQCVWYWCHICHRMAPGHQVMDCPELPGRGSALVKRDSYSPNYDGYHYIYGFEDGNLNRENWLHGPEEPHSDSIPLLINLLSLHLTFHSLSLYINNMPTRPKPKEIFMHSMYWLPRGDLHIIIQNIAFHIHHYFFKWDSPWFKALFNTSDGTPSQPDAKTLSTAFILDDI